MVFTQFHHICLVHWAQIKGSEGSEKIMFGYEGEEKDRSGADSGYEHAAVDGSTENTAENMACAGENEVVNEQPEETAGGQEVQGLNFVMSDPVDGQSESPSQEEQPEEAVSHYRAYEFFEEELSQPQEHHNKKKKRHRGGIMRTVVKYAAVGFVFGIAAFGSFYLLGKASGLVIGQENGSSKSSLSTTSTVTSAPSATVVSSTTAAYDVSDVVDSVMPSVVSIVNSGTTQVSTFWGTQEQNYESSGSGIIVGSNDTELLIATNNHVIANANELSITFDDDSTATAVVKGTSSEMDLAVVAVKLDDLTEETKNHIKIATLGDSGELKVGEPAIAIGNALGYGQSTTVGVISALDREVTVQTDSTYGFGNSQTVTSKLIQTDAAINPGNSGGALLNIKGEVIGINSVKYSSDDVEGMGYAIPISESQPILDELMNRETRTKVEDESKAAYIGIQGADVTSEAVQIYGIPSGACVVQAIEGGAADKAGIKRGDIIVKFEDQTISSMDDLSSALEYYEAGDEVEVVIARSDGGEYKEQTVTVKLDRKADYEDLEDMANDDK